MGKNFLFLFFVSNNKLIFKDRIKVSHNVSTCGYVFQLPIQRISFLKIFNRLTIIVNRLQFTSTRKTTLYSHLSSFKWHRYEQSINNFQITPIHRNVWPWHQIVTLCDSIRRSQKKKSLGYRNGRTKWYNCYFMLKVGAKRAKVLEIILYYILGRQLVFYFKWRMLRELNTWW